MANFRLRNSIFMIISIARECSIRFIDLFLNLKRNPTKSKDRQLFTGVIFQYFRQYLFKSQYTVGLYDCMNTYPDFTVLHYVEVCGSTEAHL